MAAESRGSGTMAHGADHSAIYLGPFSVLMAVAIIVSVARIYCRVQPRWRLGWEDYTLIFSFMLTVVWFVMDTILYAYGRGIENHAYAWSMVGPMEVAMGIIYPWAVNAARISMALMLLHLKQETGWKWSLQILILTQICLVIVVTSVQLAICRPLSGVWAPTPETRCIPQSGMMIYACVFNAVNILSDLVLSLMPLTFIFKINRTWKEKLLIFGLMSTGLLATAGAVAFVATLLGDFAEHTDAWINIYIDVVASIQLFLGVIAASLPLLKSPVHGLLIRWRVIRLNNHAAGSPENFLSEMSHGRHFKRQLRVLPQLSESEKTSASRPTIATPSSVDKS